MKKAIILLLFLLFLPAITASINNARDIIVTTNLSTSITFPDQISRITANVSFFPKTTQFQRVQSLTIEGAEAEQYPESVLLTWNNAKGELPYVITSKVLSKKQYPEITFAPPAIPHPSVMPFTKPTAFITSDNPEIQQLAQEITKNTQTVFESAFELAQWVRDNIEYDLSTITAEASQPATWTLKNKRGVCDELSLLFIAMVRALDIPARYIIGIAYTESELFEQGWVPHAWAEVYINEVWVPFDLTFGQFGWLDASHITVKILQDTDRESVSYMWSEPTLPKFGELKIAAKLETTIQETESPIEFSLEPILSQVYPGSYVPVKVFIKNKMDRIVSITLEAVQAPGHIKESTYPTFLLPHQEKSIYLIVPVPSNMSLENYYQGPVVLRDNFGFSSSTTIEFGKFYSKITRKNAELVNSIAKKQDKENNLPDLYFDCIQNKRAYNPGEAAEIICTLKNNYRASKTISLCFNECITLELLPDQEEIKTFPYLVENETELEITAFIEKDFAKQYVPILIVQNPDVTISNLKCPILTSEEQGQITFTLTSEEDIEDIFLGMKNMKAVKLKNFKGIQQVVIPITGELLQDQGNFLLLFLTYSDVDGVRYELAEVCPLEQKLNWLQKIWSSIKNIFTK